MCIYHFEYVNKIHEYLCSIIVNLSASVNDISGINPKLPLTIFPYNTKFQLPTP